LLGDLEHAWIMGAAVGLEGEASGSFRDGSIIA
jgi:hypothetical protein